ncbi:SprT-like family-domain-containing protein [Chytridium lagenaria]|nr:SprT-like family-domain-containing protein [Chytridium lagenaria]
MCYYYKGGYCSVRLSEPLLKLRPKSDYINTLLHEMIHAYLFITQRNTDRDGHGPAFLDLAKRINDSEGTKITVYHNFRDEVNHYRTHVWKCQGTCGRLLKRAMNRPPRPTDWWWSDHQAKCGGDYIKISSPPENSKAKKGKGKTDKTEKKSTHATIEDEQVALRKIEKAKEGGPKRKRPPDTEPDNVKKEKTSSDDDPTKAIPTQISTSDVQITHPELLARRLNRFQTSTSSFSKPLISIIDDKRLEKPNEAFRAFVVLTDDEEEVKMEGKAPRSPSVSSTTSSHKPSIPASSPIPVDAKPLVSLPTQPLSSLASESTFSAPTISAGPSREIKQFGGISPPPLNNLPSIVPRPKSPITAFPPQRPQTGTPKLVQCPCCGRLVRHLRLMST